MTNLSLILVTKDALIWYGTGCRTIKEVAIMSPGCLEVLQTGCFANEGTCKMS